MKFSTTVRAVGAAFAALSLATLPSVPNAVAGESHDVAGVVQHLEPTGSVETAPDDLVSDAGVGRKDEVRVVAVTLGEDGAPSFAANEVRGAAAATEAVEEAQDLEGVVAVEIDSPVTIADYAGATNDPFFDDQWGLSRTRLPGAWNVSTGDKVKVAVVDTGIDISHPDLVGRVTDGAEFDYTKADRDADQGAGFLPVDDEDLPGKGWEDPHGHGTHVAGIIAANVNNGLQIAGGAPGAAVMPVKVFDENGAGASSDVARGIVWAVNNGADVVNLSLTMDRAAASVEAAIAYAVERNVIVVAAAANTASNGQLKYPSAYPGVIGVAATDKKNARTTFSSAHSGVDVAAPGSFILSLWPSHRRQSVSGTSQAAAFVSAAAALAVEANGGSLTPAAFERTIKKSSKDLGVKGRDDEFGYGLLDAAALVCDVASCDASKLPGDVLVGPTSGEPETEKETPASVVTRSLMTVFEAYSHRVAHNTSVPLRVWVTDTNTGASVANEDVLVVIERAGKSTIRRALKTNKKGVAKASVRVRSHTVVRLGETGLKVRFTAVPNLKVVSHTKKKAAIKVSAGAQRKIEFQKRVNGRWKTRKVVTASKAGKANVSSLPAGKWRAYVAKSDTHAAKATGWWRVR
ncbi:S8 family serine peptidase [Nocardioides yefusunii]|uniref:S8 family serine peptidase n=1 Tax=Nocardioides yefusunii TaxID=2500546 RepID=A0ABW1QTX1_9ACTN|nr:S8 family serine peptidase [Nocardioides yefusunii]